MRKEMNRQGYTLVEVLTVVGIISLLVTLSGPAYLQHVKRATGSEAVAMMSLIRQAQKDYKITSGQYYDVASGYIQNAIPDSVTSGIPFPSTAGVDVDASVATYFSNHVYSVDATSPVSARFSNPPVVDFLITVNGSASVACTDLVTTNCALNPSRVSAYDLEMDNSGRVFISYDNGTTWRSY